MAAILNNNQLAEWNIRSFSEWKSRVKNERWRPWIQDVLFVSLHPNNGCSAYFTVSLLQAELAALPTEKITSLCRAVKAPRSAGVAETAPLQPDKQTPFRMYSPYAFMSVNTECSNNKFYKMLTSLQTNTLRLNTTKR